VLHKGAVALGLTVDELAAIVEERELVSHDDPDDLLARFMAAQPHRIVIRTDFIAHAGTPVVPLEYHWVPPGAATGSSEAIEVKGQCLVPDIRDGDVIIVNRAAEVNAGNPVAYVYQDRLQLGKAYRMDGLVYVDNAYVRINLQECPQVAMVIQIERKLR
jgi:hypothetical protein